MTGGYDGVARIFRAPERTPAAGGASPQLLCAFGAAAAAAIKAVAWLPAAERADVALGGLDGGLSVWRAAVGAEAAACVCVCVGHEGSVEALAASSAPDAPAQLASGGRDGLVCLWELGGALEAAAGAGPAAEPAAAKGGAEGKRRKTAGAAEPAPAPTPPTAPPHTVSPSSVLRGHSQPVTGVAWAEAHALVSASWDGSVRTWDLSTGQCAHSVGGLKAVQALAVSAAQAGGGVGGSVLAATGHDNGLVQLWDARAKPSEAAAARLLSHAAWVTSVAFCAASPFQLLSGAHDGCLKVWDVRGKLPLHTLAAHADKVLCAGWGGPEGGLILSGGADRKLLVHAMPA